MPWFGHQRRQRYWMRSTQLKEFGTECEFPHSTFLGPKDSFNQTPRPRGTGLCLSRCGFFWSWKDSQQLHISYVYQNPFTWQDVAAADDAVTLIQSAGFSGNSQKYHPIKPYKQIMHQCLIEWGSRGLCRGKGVRRDCAAHCFALSSILIPVQWSQIYLWNSLVNK